MHSEYHPRTSKDPTPPHNDLAGLRTPQSFFNRLVQHKHHQPTYFFFCFFRKEDTKHKSLEKCFVSCTTTDVGCSNNYSCTLCMIHTLVKSYIDFSLHTAALFFCMLSVNKTSPTLCSNKIITLIMHGKRFRHDAPPPSFPPTPPSYTDTYVGAYR